MPGGSGWGYFNPVRIQSGPGIIGRIGELAGGGRIAVITSPGWTRRGLTGRLEECLGASLAAVHDGVGTNPDFPSIREACAAVKPGGFDVLLAVGGGSVLDTAKALAAASAGGGPDWLEDHLKGKAPQPADFRPARIIAVPTTAGTGSEVTMWGTVWDMEAKRKYSISHPALYPALALLDPELTLSLPEPETVHCALDALSHAMEAVWNRNHNPVSDSHALKAISLIFSHLPRPAGPERTPDCRRGLLEASLLAGLASSNTRTALAHSISYPLTARFGLPHGLACSLPLPHLLRFNAARAPERIAPMAAAMGAAPEAEAMVSALQGLFRKAGVASDLKSHGVGDDMKGVLLSEAVTPGRAENNIADFTRLDLEAIIAGM